MDAPLRGLHRQALQIFRAALKAADPYQAVLRRLRPDPKPYRNIFVIGAGKASAQMARAVERLLGARITGGLINVKDGHGAKLRRVEIQNAAIRSLMSVARWGRGASHRLRVKPAPTI